MDALTEYSFTAIGKDMPDQIICAGDRQTERKRQRDREGTERWREKERTKARHRKRKHS